MVLSYIVCSGPISCVLALRWMVMSWVNAVWSSSLLCVPKLWGPVLYCAVRPYIGRSRARLMRSGPLHCGPVLHYAILSYILRSGPTLDGPQLGWCGLVFFAVVRSYIMLS